jgi:iron complex outermembrane receptor protein
MRLGGMILLGATAAVAMVGTGAKAQADAVAFHIPAGTMDSALRLYARATGIQILYRPEDVAGVRFSGLEATLGAEEALRRIVQDAGLTVRRPSRKVVVLARESASISDGDPQQTATAGALTSADSSDDIIVTGTNVRGGAVIAPVRRIERSELIQSGRATIADAIAAQPGNFGGTGNPVATLTGADRATINSSMAPAANLRGLGSDATLTLFDGRRVAGSSDGASAIYGSDAVGGVVNILLRHRFAGVEARLRGGGATDGGLRSFIGGFAAGTTWSSGSLMTAYEFEHRQALSGADRSYSATGDLRPFGGTDHRSYQSSPATILGYSAAARAYLPQFAVPALPGGRQPTVADLVPGSNLSNLFAGLDLTPRIDRHSTYARVEQSLGTSVDLFAEGRYSHRTFGYASPAASTILLLPPANPYFLPVAGQASVPIGYSFFPEAGPVRASGRVSALSATLGATWRAFAGWTIDAYGSFSREISSERSENTLNSTLFNEALGATVDSPATSYSTARDGFFNPFGPNTAVVIDFITSGYTQARRRSSLSDGNLKAEGPLLTFPGGQLRLAIGGSVRRETFASFGETFNSGVVPAAVRPLAARRTVSAVYGELAVPLISAANAIAGLRDLRLSLAARHERYGDVGSTTNPKLGIGYRPVEDLLIRASWGTSFRAPALTEVNARRTVSPTSLPDAVGVSRPSIFVSGGNADLKPEKARTLSGGFVLTPSTTPGLRLEVNVFSTRFRDRIAQPVLQDILRALTNPALTPFVQFVRPATSPSDLAIVQALLAEPGAGTSFVPATSYVAIADGRYVNTSTLEVSGLDYDLSFSTRSGSDRLSATLSATWLFDYSEGLTPASPQVDRLDTVGNPAGIKARLTGSWEHGGLVLTAIGNYVGGYVDDVAIRRRAVRPFTTMDASIGYTPATGPLRSFRMALSALNVFDVAPPFVDRSNGIGFDAANASPFGRTLALEIFRAF